MPTPDRPTNLDATDHAGLDGHDLERFLDNIHDALNRPAPIAGGALKTANHTLVLADASTIVSMDTAGGGGQHFTLTVPTNAAVPFPIGTLIGVFRRSPLGSITIVGATGVAVVSTDVDANNGEGGQTNVARTITLEGGEASLWKRNTDTWVLVGHLARLV